jgi:sporulation protein YlmC with PRC-barrel domain
MSRGTFFRREEIAGKSVYDLEGKYVGKVIDIGFEASGEAGLIVEVDKNKAEFFGFSVIQAISDIVLVRRKVTVTICPNCGSTVKPGAAFCTKCGAKL